jgi:hypothetical protein
MKIEFENGSIVQTVDTIDSVRSKSSEVIYQEPEQDETDIAMQNELDKIAAMLDGSVFKTYGDYEDKVGELIDGYCPVCKKEISNTRMGIFILLGSIRNYIRTKADIRFEENV